MDLIVKIIIFSMLANVCFASEHVVCDSPTPQISEEVDQLSKENCKTINELNKCKARTIDPEALKKKITLKIKAAEENKERIKQLLKEKRKVSSSNLFSEQGSRGNYEFIFDTLKKMDPTLDTTKLKDKIINDYLSYAEKNDCKPRIRTGNIWRICPDRLEVKGNRNAHIAEFKKILAEPENEKERLKCLSRNRGDEGVKRLMICGTKSVIAPRKATHRIHSPCAGNFIQNFKDNAWEIPEFSDLLSTGKVDQKLLNCIKGKISKGAKIDKISIRSSSNLLNNTGVAAERFCKKGFKALSEARANYAKEQLVPQLLTEAGLNPSELADDAYKLNANGDNGDGTSGPCPYKYSSSSKEYMDTDFAKSGKRRSEIDEGKYLKVSISFKEQRTKLENQEYVVKARHACKRISFSCSK